MSQGVSDAWISEIAIRSSVVRGSTYGSEIRGVRSMDFRDSNLEAQICGLWQRRQGFNMHGLWSVLMGVRIMDFRCSEGLIHYPHTHANGVVRGGTGAVGCIAHGVRGCKSMNVRYRHAVSTCMDVWERISRCIFLGAYQRQRVNPRSFVGGSKTMPGGG